MIYIFFILLLLPWSLSSILFPFNQSFYNSLNLPNFTPPNYVFIIVWSIIYFLITISFFLILKKDKLNSNYIFAFLLNYILNQSFSLFFFYLNNLTLTLYTTIMLFASTIYLFFETKKINKISSYLLIPYLLWCSFGVILFTTVFFLN